jgi:hypothetical protein
MPMLSGRYFSGPKNNIEREIDSVEGIDDAYFLDRILELQKADESRVGIIYLEGQGKLDENVKQLTRSAAMTREVIKRYAIITDSDADPGGTLREIHKVLARYGQPQPAHGMCNGAAPAVGLFLIPSASEDGNLEKLLLSTIDKDGKLIYVRKFSDDLQASFGQLDDQEKRLSRIYLDCCDGHYRGAGRAFSAGKFEAGHAALDALKRFVTLMVS